MPHDEGVFGGEGAQTMKKVIFAGGQFLAIGEELIIDELGWDLAVWVSPDGLSWTR